MARAGGSTPLCAAFEAGSVPVIPQWIVDRIRTWKGDRAKAQEQRDTAAPLSVTARERSYAVRALENEYARVAQAPAGTRNETLNKAAFDLGSMTAAGWIETDLVRSRLFAAAEACGLGRDDGPSAARATIESGLKAGGEKPRSPLHERGFGTIQLAQPIRAPGPSRTCPISAPDGQTRCRFRPTCSVRSGPSGAWLMHAPAVFRPTMWPPPCWPARRR